MNKNFIASKRENQLYFVFLQCVVLMHKFHIFVGSNEKYNTLNIIYIIGQDFHMASNR